MCTLIVSMWVRENRSWPPEGGHVQFAKRTISKGESALAECASRGSVGRFHSSYSQNIFVDEDNRVLGVAILNGNFIRQPAAYVAQIESCVFDHQNMSMFLFIEPIMNMASRNAVNECSRDFGKAVVRKNINVAHSNCSLN